MAGDYVLHLASYSATFVCVYSNLRIQQHRACLPPTFPRYPVRIVPTNIGSDTCGHASNGAIAGAQHHVEVGGGMTQAQRKSWATNAKSEARPSTASLANKVPLRQEQRGDQAGSGVESLVLLRLKEHLVICVT